MQDDGFVVRGDDEFSAWRGEYTAQDPEIWGGGEEEEEEELTPKHTSMPGEGSGTSIARRSPANGLFLLQSSLLRVGVCMCCMARFDSAMSANVPNQLDDRVVQAAGR